MSPTKNNLEKIAELACLDVENELSHLTKDINAIIDFVEQVDTSNITPLFHPFNLHQRLRPDIASEKSCLEELAEITPLSLSDS